MNISQQIINVTSRLNDSDIDKISRWIRCLFSLAVNSETEIAEDLLDQVVTIAGHAKSVRTIHFDSLSHSLYDRHANQMTPLIATDVQALSGRRDRMACNNDFQSCGRLLLFVLGRGLQAVGREGAWYRQLVQRRGGVARSVAVKIHGINVGSLVGLPQLWQRSAPRQKFLLHLVSSRMSAPRMNEVKISSYSALPDIFPGCLTILDYEGVVR